MATSIDDNEADEKSDKPRCQLINIRCTSIRIGGTAYERAVNKRAVKGESFGLPFCSGI